MESVVLVLHIVLAAAITGLVLLQRSSEGGLGGLAGSGGGANGLFTGRQKGNLLTKLTSYFFIGFICTSLTLVIMAKSATAVEQVSILPTSTEQAD